MPQIEADLVTTLTGLARAADINDQRFLSHAERVAYISFRLGKELKLQQSQLAELTLSALVHDIGIVTTNEKLSLADLEPERGTVSAHCQRGYELLKSTNLFKDLAVHVLRHHDFYCPKLGIIPAIIHLADRVDFAIDKNDYYLWQVEDVIHYFTVTAKGIFHPDVVNALVALSRTPSFWLDLQYANYPTFSEELKSFRRLLTLDELEEIAGLIAVIVDTKSPHTASHSQGVARIAEFLATKAGLPAQRVHLVKIAGLLHDLGKLAIPDEILCRPGPLSDKERALMKQHTYHTYHIIGSIGPGVQQLQRWAAFHHERLDGTGYPFGLSAEDLEPEARLIAIADLVQALLETRPYKQSLAKDEVISILQQHIAAKHLDKALTELAIEHLTEITQLI